METKKVLIVMGSDSDFDKLEPAWKVLDTLGVPYEVRVASAHRTPDVVQKLAEGARDAGFGVVLAAAGGAAHLAGVVAAHTVKPVLGVPLPGGVLDGGDALLSTVQMPAGIPVATFAVGSAGARNAAILAAQILAVADEGLAAQMRQLKADMAAGKV